MSAKRGKRRFGCLTVLLILIVIIVLICAGVWMFVLNKGSGKGGKQIINGPVDPEASAMVEQMLTDSGLPGIKVAVVPLPGGPKAALLPDPPEEGEAEPSYDPQAESESTGNAAMLVIDPSYGFVPAAGSEGKRNQALEAIKRLVELNRANEMDLKQVGLEYREDGKAIVALAVSMEAMTDLVDGRTDDAGFLADVNIELKDIGYMQKFLK